MVNNGGAAASLSEPLSLRSLGSSAPDSPESGPQYGRERLSPYAQSCHQDNGILDFKDAGLPQMVMRSQEECSSQLLHEHKD